MHASPPSSLKAAVLDRIASKPAWVWTPGDFAALGSRAAVDKVLQRLTMADELRRIDRGLYDRPRLNPLTGQMVVPDYRAVIAAVARRDQAPVLIDGLTAANELGLTTAVPARIEAFVAARLRPIHLGRQELRFHPTSPGRLFWAGRPAMRIVQALHWLRDGLDDPPERQRVLAALARILSDDEHGDQMREDLRSGFSTLPIWMQEFVRPLLPAQRERDTGSAA